MCDHIASKEILPDDFFETVIQREELGSTAFGNMIALPHPDGLITNSTFEGFSRQRWCANNTKNAQLH